MITSNQLGGTVAKQLRIQLDANSPGQLSETQMQKTALQDEGTDSDGSLQQWHARLGRGLVFNDEIAGTAQ